MEQITVENSTTLKNVDSWLRQSSSDLHIRLTRDSDVLPFAEGPALNAIAALRERRSRIHVSTTFDLDLWKQDADFGCLVTLFGLQLLYDSVDVKDQRGTDIRSELLNTIWRRVIDAEGCLGTGVGQYIFFRDPDYVVPQCLGPRGLRPGHRFSYVLKRLANSLGALPGFGDSKVEENLLAFLYEAATNANVHGARSTIGIRGITVRKMIFNNEDEIRRRALPYMLRQYCQRAWSGRTHPLLLISFTVSDLGPGIQNTLPPLDGESSPERLMRAFRYGVSCKPSGSDTTSGQGLTKILESASILRALLIVTSANLLAYRDFSQERKPDEADVLIHPKELSVTAGTSLTLLLEPPRSSPDQQMLDFTD